MAETRLVGLTALPNELLDEIIGLLPRSTVYMLALVCKKTHAAANVNLYKFYKNFDAPSEAPFRLFLRTMCERPQLAAMVRKLDVRGWRSEFEVATGAAWKGFTTLPHFPQSTTRRSRPLFLSVDKDPATATQDFKLFLDTAVALGLIAKPDSTVVAPLKSTVQWGEVLKEDADFVRLLKHGIEDAHFIMLCALLPNLDWIGVNGLSFYPTLDWYTFLSRPKGALQNLKLLMICGSLPHSKQPILRTTLQILDILPKLESIHLGNMSVQGHRHTVDNLPTKTLGYFYLENCAIRHRLLKKMFAGQNVKWLLYTPNCRAIDEVNAGAAFTEAQVTEDLGPSTKTLKRLTLYPTTHSDEPRIREYSCLDCLDMPHPGLLPPFRPDAGPEIIAKTLRLVLPRSLRTLSLAHILPIYNMEAIVEQLAQLKIQGFLPHIERVALFYAREAHVFGILFDTIVFEMVAKLEAILKEAEIELDINLTDE